MAGALFFLGGDSFISLLALPYRSSRSCSFLGLGLYGSAVAITRSTSVAGMRILPMLVMAFTLPAYEYLYPQLG